jgi:pyruvate dehydrogenase E1 component alpha subunit
VHACLSEAADRARRGEGPTLVEAVTYRFWGHYFGDAMTYMPPEEREAAMTADPVPAFRDRLVEGGYATDDELTALEDRVEAAITDAVEFALASPLPDPAELSVDVYADVQGHAVTV